jgi:hypothetical protein
MNLQKEEEIWVEEYLEFYNGEEATCSHGHKRYVHTVTELRKRTDFCKFYQLL